MMFPPRNTSRPYVRTAPHRLLVTPSAEARRGERARARVARLSPLFNFTRGVPKGYLISWMGDSSNTHTVFLAFL
jgi:hypothetical protein